MSLSNLENLVRSGQLKQEAANRQEYDGLVAGGEARLMDAINTQLSIESRFDLAYNAAHALCLAALRRSGFRPANKRYIVFQVLPHTLRLGPDVWRVLDQCHNARNVAEYEGNWDADQGNLLEDLLVATKRVAAALSTQPWPAAAGAVDDV